MIKKLLTGLFTTAVTIAAPADGEWSIATAKDHGRPIIIRYRENVPLGVSPTAYPNMVAISWKFESESGMPSSDEKQRMNVLEDSVSNLVESKRQAYLTVIVTGNGICEWQFYSQDNEEFMRLLNEALSGKPPFPISVSTQRDPAWTAYYQFASKK